MEFGSFKSEIKATPEKVWQTLFSDASYPRWTEVFCEGSHSVTDWQQGSKAHFLDDKGRGMFALLEKVEPYKFMSIKALGEIIDGRETIDSEGAAACAGSSENYTLIPLHDGTLLTVSLIGDHIPQQFQDFMNDVWPKAMSRIKQIAEE